LNSTTLEQFFETAKSQTDRFPVMYTHTKRHKNS
jgi:hypothetical protein